MQNSKKKTTWEQVMYLRKNDEANGVANLLDNDDVNTIVATADFFGADDTDLHQIILDLKYAKFRLFDWLAMGVQGRIECQEALKVFVHSFLKVNGVPSKFIEDLRVTDYDIDDSWRDIEISC